MIKLSDYVAKRLKEHYEITNLFMVSGGGAMHLNDSLGRYIPYICNHHEQACAIAAEGYARTNQKLAVVNVTTGPGGLNCLNGVFGQWTDSVPVLYLSGQVKREMTLASHSNIPLRQLGDQEVDIVSIVEPITKYAKMVTEPNKIKYYLDKAIHKATNGRFGPVWLDIPIDVQASMIDEDKLVNYIPETLISEDFDIEVVLSKIQESKRPLIIAGHGIRLSNSREEFLQFIETLNLPVVTTFNGLDIIEDEHPNYIGRIGTIGQRAGNFALQNADLIVCLGTRNNIRQVSYNYENFAKNAYKIVVDVDQAELDKPTIKPDIKIQMNLKEFFDQINKDFGEGCRQTCSSGDSSDHSIWLNWCKERKEKYSFKNTKEYQDNNNNDDTINPYYFTKLLTENLGKSDVVVSANATPSICLFQAGVMKGQRILMNSGDASMGYDLPASIGACIANDRKNTICLAGDGSIMMNLQELQTIKHHDLPIKIFVLNNNGYVSIKQTQTNFFNGRMTGSGIDSGVTVPDFCEVGKAFGIRTVKLNDNKNLSERISEVLEADEPVLCEVVIKNDYTFTPKLSSRKLEDGTMVSPSLEDMFPFLDRAEYEENMIK